MATKARKKMCEQVRELKQLRNVKKAHFCMLGANINAEDMEDGCGLDHEDHYKDGDEEDGFPAGAVKSLKCFAICTCNAIPSRYLPLATPVLSVSNPVRTAVLTFVSILRTNNTVFAQHALVVSPILS